MKKQINIIVGLPGSGKSSLVNYLKFNDLLVLNDYQLLDLDEYIGKFLKLEAGELLGQWIVKNGFEKFRNIETECLKELIDKGEKLILAVGGGTINFNNLKYLRDNAARLFAIEITSQESIERTKNDKNRPLSKKPVSELLQILEDRKKLLQTADYFIDGSLPIEHQAKIFLEILQNP